MATRADNFAVSQGLDSITRAVLGNFMARQQREQLAAEEKRREQERADRLAFQAWQQQDRERQRKQQEDEFAATTEERKANAADRAAQRLRQTRLDSAAELEKRTAKEQGAAYNAARLGSTVSPGMQSAAGFLTSPDAPVGKGLPNLQGQSFTEQPMDVTPEGIARAAATAGQLTPGLDEKLASEAIRRAGLTDKPGTGEAADVKPQPFKVQLENGAQVVGIHNPRTGAYQVFDGEKQIVAKQLTDDRGRPVPGKFVVDGKVIDAKQPELIKTKEIYDELARLDAWEEEDSPAKKRMKDWEAKFPPSSRVGNAALGQQATEMKAAIAKETAAVKARRNSLMKTLQMLAGDAAPDLQPAEPPAGTPATVAAPAPAPAAPPAAVGKPLSREQAALFLKQAGGDKDKARALAKQNGFTF